MRVATRVTQQRACDAIKRIISRNAAHCIKSAANACAVTRNDNATITAEYSYAIFMRKANAMQPSTSCIVTLINLTCTSSSSASANLRMTRNARARRDDAKHA